MPSLRTQLSASQLVALAASDRTMPGARARFRGAAMAVDDLPAVVVGVAANLPPSTRPAFAPYEAPVLGGTQVEGDRDLTALEAAFIMQLPDDPAAISNQDATTLARMYAEARSMSPDRRIVEAKLGPVRRRHADLQRLRAAEIELSQLSTYEPTKAADWPAWREAIARQLSAEVPELTLDEAEVRAARLVSQEVAANSKPERRLALRQEIGELCRANGVDATYYVGARTWGVAGDNNRSDFRPAEPEAPR